MERLRTNAVYRHSFVTRVTHGTFSVSFLALALSGVQLVLHQHWLPVNVALWHRIFGVAMLGSGLVYVVSAAISGELRKVLFTAADASGVVPMVQYYLRLRAQPPAHTDYNPLQKLAYTAVLLSIGPLIAASGLALWQHVWFLRPFHVLFGGRSAVIWHLGFALEIVLFFFGHMVMVATTGLRNNLRAMVTGWYTKQAPVAERSAATP